MVENHCVQCPVQCDLRKNWTLIPQDLADDNFLGEIMCYTDWTQLGNFPTCLQWQISYQSWKKFEICRIFCPQVKRGGPGGVASWFFGTLRWDSNMIIFSYYCGVISPMLQIYGLVTMKMPIWYLVLVCLFFNIRFYIIPKKFWNISTNEYVCTWVL